MDLHTSAFLSGSKCWMGILVTCFRSLDMRSKHMDPWGVKAKEQGVHVSSAGRGMMPASFRSCGADCVLRLKGI